MAELIDISFPLTGGIAIYPGNPGFSVERVSRIEDGGVNISSINIGSHTGTHIDAPSHFLPGGADVSQIPLNVLNGPVKVIAAEELEQTSLSEGDRVILKTNNSSIFDGIHLLDDYAAFDYDTAKRFARVGVRLVGIDYLTIEPPRHKRMAGRSMHRILLEAGILILEGLRLAHVPPGKYELMCLPLNIVGCDGCPVRAVLKV